MLVGKCERTGFGYACALYWKWCFDIRSVTLALLGIWSTPSYRQQLLGRGHGWPQRLVQHMYVIFIIDNTTHGSIIDTEAVGSQGRTQLLTHLSPKQFKEILVRCRLQ